MRIKRLLTDGQLYDVEILTEAMRANLGDITFQVPPPYLISPWSIGLLLIPLFYLGGF